MFAMVIAQCSAQPCDCADHEEVLLSSGTLYWKKNQLEECHCDNGVSSWPLGLGIRKIGVLQESPHLEGHLKDAGCY